MRPAVTTRSRVATIALVLSLGVACNDSPGPATTGALSVTAPATGNGVPTSSGTVTVDDTAPKALALNGSVTYAALVVGNHAIAFTGVQAPNCSVVDSNPVIVTVQPSTTTHVAFPTECFGVGSIEVTTTTTGVDLDTDGYSVVITNDALGGWNFSLSANGSSTLTDAHEGTYRVSLNGLALNCLASPSNPISVTVVNGQTTRLALAVTCVAFGVIQVTATTSGMDFDPDGYVAVADLALGGGVTVPVNGSASFTQVGAGVQNVTLSGLAANCSVVGVNPVSVTVASGATTDVSFAITCAPVIPVGSAIAFTSLRDGNAEVYALRAGDSFTPVNLTNNAAADGAPVWSPDGGAIAFATSRDFDDEIYKMSADGSTPMNLTLRAGSDQEPAWSPNGQTIAFVSTRNDQGDSVPAEIFVMTPDGSGARTALTANSGGSTSPAWSPDGTRIAFVSVRDGNAEIYVMNADGSAPVNLTKDAAADDHPVWAPDGTRIAFLSDRGGHLTVYVMGADGSGLTAVAPSGGNAGFVVTHESVAWSSDGTRLALSAAGIRVANADGSGSAQIVAADGVTHCSHNRVFNQCISVSASTPAWSPDGTRIAYHLMTKICRTRAATCTPASPFSSIRIMNPDGTSPFVLTSEAGLGAIRPVWKP